jgi:hypothetical protein
VPTRNSVKRGTAVRNSPFFLSPHNAPGKTQKTNGSRKSSGIALRYFALGKLIVVGVPLDPMQLSAFPLVFGGRSIYGSLAGTAIDTEDALAFSVLENIRPMRVAPSEGSSSQSDEPR